MAIRGGANDSKYNSAATGTDFTGYIPELFSKKMLKNFYEVTLWTSLANTDYTGEIKAQGDKIWMATTPTISINAYQVGDELTYETPSSEPRELLIDQGQSWSYKIEDVDAIQTHLNLLNAFASEAGEAMAQVIDKDVLKYICVLDGATDATPACDADNHGASAGAISGGIALGVDATPLVPADGDAMVDLIIDCGLVLDEQNIAKANRWIVLPSWACARLKKGDLKRADVTGDSTGVIRNGLVGEIDGMMVYRSNNVYESTTTAGSFYVPFGTKEGLTFASQLIKTESLRLEKQFGDAYRGLNVYGRAIAQPTAIGFAVIAKA